MTLTIRRSSCGLNFAYFHQVQDVDIIYFILVTTPQSPGKYRRPKQHVSSTINFGSTKHLSKCGKEDRAAMMLELDLCSWQVLVWVISQKILKVDLVLTYEGLEIYMSCYVT